MSFEADEEILQDFLVEAGEILESLSEELVELEQRADDKDLLNSIFRGFHTVKGGAGFLQIDALVDCCHAAENVFDSLRNGQRPVDSDLMDSVLNALDAVNEMFDQVRNGEEPSPASPELIARLHQLAKPVSADAPAPAPVEPVAEPEVAAESTSDSDAEPQGQGDITDAEFEALLDALDGGDAAEAATADTSAPSEEPAAAEELTGMGFDEFSSPASAESEEADEISEDEFEALLDQLHGKGKFSVGGDKAEASAPSEAPVVTSAKSSDDEISDDEFEALLDQLHGKGQFNSGIVEKFDQSETRKAAGVLSEADTSPAPSASAGESSAAVPSAAPSAKAESSVAKPSVSAPTPSASSAPAAAAPTARAGGRPDKPSANAQETTVRVDTKRLDDIMNMVGELVLVRNRLVRLGNQHDASEEVQKAVGNLDVVTTDLQNSVMKTRMQPIKKVFGRFPRVVRDLARNLKKEVNLELVGEETDLDKNLVDALADPLVHLVRNSVDHGVEAPDVREKNGKPRVGKVILSAEQEGDHILLAIQDDGAGMDAEKLRALAVERGLYEQDAADRLTENECYNLIFHPGFSTKKEISDISGRGVGMDVVKTKISQLNGSVDIDSKLGEGTRIVIKVPLTLAIMPTLMVMLKEQAFALPLVNVNEIFHLDLTKTNVVDGKEVVVVRGKPLPLFYLRRWLVSSADQGYDHENAHVVVVTVGTQQVGFVVDQLVGQEEVVIKPLGRGLHGTEGMAGATITGDGRIALILDVPSLLKRYA